MCRTVACLWLLAVAVPASAASPELNLITPRGGQRGTELTLNLFGDRLADAQELMFAPPGVAVDRLEVVNTQQLKAAVRIADDCPIGEIAVRVRTATGVSTLRTFWVGFLPAVEEKEPNNEFAKAQGIPLDSTIEGMITSEDVDYFRVELKKGQRLTAEIEGMRLAGAYFDPFLAVLDAKRFELATSDDEPLVRQDAFVSIVAPDDGSYTLMVRESAYRGDNNSRYRLHVTTGPRPTTVFPPGGRAGAEVELRYLGDPAGEIRATVKLPDAVPPRPLKLFPRDAGGTAPSPLPLRVADLPDVTEVEPNDGPARATAGEAPGAFHGVIQKPGDVDFFKFSAKKGDVYDITCFARRLGSPLDPVIGVIHADGRGIAANDDSNGPDSHLRFTAPDDHEYLLYVLDHLRQGGPTYVYRVEITPVKPRAAVSLTKYGNPPTQERQALAVPRGNRAAVLATVARQDFGGDLDASASGLPAGVKLEVERVPAGMTVIPMVFAADDDAPVAGAMAELVVRHADPTVAIDSRFEQTTELTFGQPNNTPFTQVSLDRMAVAVTDAVPFRISIVEPKVPLCRNGSMNLKVVAERKDGFNGAIRIQPLYNPPGVGATGEVVIPEGQNEVLLPMTANGNASIGTWKYVVLGIATVGDGPVTVSSPLTPIRVAAPLVALNLQKTAAEQGKPAELRGGVEVAAGFVGPAKVQLLNLPPKVTTAEQQITAETTTIAFPLTIDAASPAGQHKNIFCQVEIEQDGERIVHTAGAAELRIDPPPPPRKTEAPKPAAAAGTPAPPSDKPLSRLEQLRRQQQKDGNR